MPKLADQMISLLDQPTMLRRSLGARGLWMLIALDLRKTKNKTRTLHVKRNTLALYLGVEPTDLQQAIDELILTKLISVNDDVLEVAPPDEWEPV